MASRPESPRPLCGFCLAWRQEAIGGDNTESSLKNRKDNTGVHVAHKWKEFLKEKGILARNWLWGYAMDMA